MAGYLVRNNHALVQQFATLIHARHWFYCSGVIPADRDPDAFDEALQHKYGTDRSKHAQYRLALKGVAKVRYLRVRGQRRWWLVATHGPHAVHQEEELRDLRECPALIGGYAVAAYGGKLSVRIEREQYERLRSFFIAVAVGRSVTWLEQKLWELPFQPWKGVREQARQILAAVNHRRRKAGLIEVPEERAIRKKKRPLKVFVVAEEQE